MYLQYGSFAHLPGEISRVSIDYQLNLSQRQTAVSEIAVVRAQGMIIADGQDAIQTRAAAISSAYALNGLDLVFYKDDNNPTEISIDNLTSLSGVRITQRPSFSVEGGRAHYVTGLPFRLEAQAEYLRGTTADPLLMYKAQISVRGNGNGIKAIRPVDVGEWVKQPVTTTSPVIVTQAGTSVGKVEWRPAPAVLFPDAILNPVEDIEVTEITPDRVGEGYLGYGITWRYTMTLTDPADIAAISHPEYE